MADYVGVEEFEPTRGGTAKKVIKGRTSRVCLVADAEGLYLVSGKGYEGCSPDRPLWQRTELSPAVIRSIREQLRRAVVD